MEGYAKLNENLATGKKILSPSDDATGLRRALDFKVRINDNVQFSQNIDIVLTGLNFADEIMTSVNNALTTLTGLVTSNGRGLQDALGRAADAALTTSLKDMLVGLANTKYMDQYMFAGYASDVKPYDAGTAPSYEYQGDAGIIKTPIGNGVTLQTNVPGSDAFSYTLPAPKVIQLIGGENAHYTPGAGTAVTVDIYDTTDTTLLKSFTFSNVIQMTDLLSTAISAHDTMTVQALMDPFTQYRDQARAVQADIGTRLSRLDDQSTMLTQVTNDIKTTLATVEDADLIEVAAKLKMTEVTLSAVRESASRVMSASLFDFLK
jgi:flagellar hook-associated protein 3 FlgL